MITILLFFAGILAGFAGGFMLGRARECDFCNDCAYKIYYLSHYIQ